MKAIAFDFGDTLVEYEGVPLNWEAHYPEALENLAAFLGVAAASTQIERGCAVLRRYNTRIYPRTEETTFAILLSELLRCFEAPVEAEELACATAFFRPFRQRLRCFPDTRATLDVLRRKGLQVGVFTDVPYGMPSSLVRDDVRAVGLEHAFDAFLTSRDAGCRKPAAATLQALARALGCAAHEIVYVGNERKDVEVARAFGCRSLVIDRDGCSPDWGQDGTIVSLTESGTNPADWGA